MAPEVIRQENYGKPADIWSMGCTVLQMATGYPPWKSLKFENVNALLFYVGTQNKTPPLPSNISDALHSFLHTCFQRNPAERSQVEELLKHPFLDAADEGLNSSLSSFKEGNDSLIKLNEFIDDKAALIADSAEVC
jgi:serine/threonine protein kinase